MKSIRQILLPGLAMAALGLGQTTRADVVYDSGVSASQATGAVASDAAWPNFTGPGTFAGGEFTLTSAAVIDEVHWTGIYTHIGGGTPVPPSSDDFTIEVHDFSQATPSISPIFSFNVGDAVNRTDTGIANRFSFETAIAGTAMGPGHYLLSISDDTTGHSDQFYWSFGASGTGHFTRPNGSTFWTPQSSGPLAFTLLGSTAVPEPASLVMFGTGVLGLLGYASRRHRASRA